MLTKDLLKFTVRGTKVYPRYVDYRDEAHLETARALESLFEASVNLRYCDLQKNISENFSSPSPLVNGLIKLLEDRCQFQEVSGEIEEFRWQVFQLAQNIRHQNLELDRRGFAEQIASKMQMDTESIRQKLYSDLPVQRIIMEFQPYGAENLLHRYNCAQIQGLLLRARHLEIEIPALSLIEKRRLFQKLKFHRLLVEHKSDQPFCIRLSGPMSLFESNLTYGLRLASFFPYILHAKSWRILADIRINGKDLTLDVSSKRTIRSHYKLLSGYIPEEYQSFIELFNKRSEKSGWQVQAADDFLNLGKQSYCFPDFKLLAGDGRRIYVELFHRWHQHQLQQRLEVLEAKSSEQLLIGICNSLKINPKIEEKLMELQQLGFKSFKFKGFPSPRAVLAQLT